IAGEHAERARHLAAQQNRGLAVSKRLETPLAKLRLDVFPDRRSREIDTPDEAAARAAAGRREERLLMHERRGREDAPHALHPAGDTLGLLEPLATALEDQQVRASGDDPIADAVLEAGHDGQHHDESRHAEEDTTKTDPDEQREVGPLPARSEIFEAEEQLERQPVPHVRPSPASSPAARPPSGLSRGNRITSRIDGWFANIMSSRSIPMPSPAAGGMPSSSARTWSSSSQ